MKNSGIRNRLSWNPVRPWPFESSWSTFLKLITINALSWKELQYLIKNDNFLGPDDNLKPLFLSYWIDFTKYSSLIGVDGRKLKEGFLDQQGLNVDHRGQFRIRHCKDCWQMGYHCTLFTLDLVSHCPWHGAPLVDAYDKLEDLELFGGRIQPEEIFTEGTAMPSKANTVPSLRMPLSEIGSSLSEEFASVIPSFCNRLIGWWATLNISDPDAELLLLPLKKCGSARGLSRTPNVELLLGYAQTLAPRPIPWLWSIKDHSSTAVLWRDYAPFLENSSLNLTEFFRLARKAVRRHVFCRFVKPHRACLRKILRMKNSERLNLHSGTVCTVCLAFLAWTRVYDACYSLALQRMSNEGIDDSTAYRRTLYLSPNAQYANFLRIWAHLEILLTETNIYIDRPLEGKITFDLPFTILDRESSLEISGDHFCVKVIIPDARYLASITTRRCQFRSRISSSMYNQAAADKFDNWSWTNSVHDELFRIKNFCFELRSFWHLIV
ncbi:hypothetical protein P3T40_004502 [Paraburkholderia sp. EB58]|uniref:hypothetical protein n=1 Tax=Paraburkholderia sp. EB58 TaxID=3035125 RepID=UPI003D1E6A14